MGEGPGEGSRVCHLQLPFAINCHPARPIPRQPTTHFSIRLFAIAITGRAPDLQRQMFVVLRPSADRPGIVLSLQIWIVPSGLRWPTENKDRS
jgi:hypothetical protein